jgi:methyl halide transferase
MYAPIDKPAYWEEKYIANQTYWDTKSAHPVFKELFNSPGFLKPGKIFIVGCGKGYDAVIAALNGFDVTAVDFSSTAIGFAKQLAAENKVKINFVTKDIFSLSDDYNESFDFVYEYTTYCAINPERRKEFALKLSSLLKKGGRLASILFPVDKKEGGPPFSIDVKEFYKNFSEYLQLEFHNRQINSIKPRKGREILQVYIKK